MKNIEEKVIEDDLTKTMLKIMESERKINRVRVPIGTALYIGSGICAGLAYIHIKEPELFDQIQNYVANYFGG